MNATSGSLPSNPYALAKHDAASINGTKTKSIVGFAIQANARAPKTKNVTAGATMLINILFIVIIQCW